MHFSWTRRNPKHHSFCANLNTNMKQPTLFSLVFIGCQHMIHPSALNPTPTRKQFRYPSRIFPVSLWSQFLIAVGDLRSKYHITHSLHCTTRMFAAKWLFPVTFKYFFRGSVDKLWLPFVERSIVFQRDSHASVCWKSQTCCTQIGFSLL